MRVIWLSGGQYMLDPNQQETILLKSLSKETGVSDIDLLESIFSGGLDLLCDASESHNKIDPPDEPIEQGGQNDDPPESE